MLRHRTALQKRDSSASRISMPALPEALTRTILPSHVNRVHHVSVSLGMLLMCVAMAAIPRGPEAPGNVEEALQVTLSILSLGTAASWLRSSHQFVVRAISESVYYNHARFFGPSILICGFDRPYSCIPGTRAVILSALPRVSLHYSSHRSCFCACDQGWHPGFRRLPANRMTCRSHAHMRGDAPLWWRSST